MRFVHSPAPASVELKMKYAICVEEGSNNYSAYSPDVPGCVATGDTCAEVTRIKKEFYEKDPSCTICGGRISDIDDAAMDHKTQYWLGGETVPENARLTHRYCNNARPRIDGEH